MLESMMTNQLEYKKLSPEEMKARGILGRLVGICANFTGPTRNGRQYSEELWEKVFNNPIMKERIENNVCYGELGHPTDREETDMEKIAINLAEVPKKGKDGKLRAVFDILDTPNGRILKTLCDYGSVIGISSRGSGDLEVDFNGNESVNPDTYNCEGFDAVLIPAVKEARLQYVTESLDTKKSLQESLKESMNNSSDNDKKIMLETLTNLHLLEEKEDKEEEQIPNHYVEVVNSIDLGINKEDLDSIKNYLQDIISYCKSVANDYSIELEPEEDVNSESIDIDNSSEEMAVDNNEAQLEELQNVLKENNELAKTITKLQEKLSVGYAKEIEMQSKLESYTTSIKKLSVNVGKVDSLKTKVNKLTEELHTTKLELNHLQESEKQLKDISEKKSSMNKLLRENLKNKDNEFLNLKNDFNSLKEDYEVKNTELVEQVNDLKANAELKENEYSQKLTKANKLVENYKSITNKAVNRYIDLQADILGVTSKEIKNKLSESYTFDDIDEVCESLREYKINLTKLPFKTSLNENTSIRVTPSKKESILPVDTFGDEIDQQLINLAGI